MKRSFFFYLFLATFAYIAAQNDSVVERPLQMIGKKVPVWEKVTVDGKQIDSNYFKGKVTVLNFFSFGCAPCLKELRILDEISRTISKDDCQILLVGDADEKAVRDLRAYKSRNFGKYKRKMGIDTLAFDMIADCPGSPLRFIHRGCMESPEQFMVNGTPTTFFINREGTIKKVCIGFPMRSDESSDAYFYALLKEASE